MSLQLKQRRKGRGTLPQAVIEFLEREGLTYWLTPGAVFTVAFGTCMLLFGLLALLMKKRKTASEPSVKHFANPVRATVRPKQNGQPGNGSRLTTASGRSSSLLSSSGALYVPREGTKVGLPESSARLITPLNSSALRGQPKETHANMISSLLESINPIAGPENGTSKVTAPISAIGETNILSPAVEERVSLREVKALQVPAIPAAPDRTDQTASNLPAAAVERDVYAPIPEIVPVVASEELKPATNLLEFHGLKQQPFDVTPDPAYLYFSPSHGEALVSLRQGIEHLRGFMMLVADPGMGKTTLINKLMEELADSARIVFLFQTQCSSLELLTFILDELEVDHTGMDVVAMHRALNQALLEDMLRGRRFVLIIDEAQNLQAPVLETIRLLSNFETTHSKLIQIVLVGQLQLADVLKQHGLKQLRQRVAVLASLKALNVQEVSLYVERRLRAAKWSGTPIFTPEALAQIAESSRGIPRSINNLCFNALLAAFASREKIIGAALIKSVAEKLNIGALASRIRIEQD